MAFLVGASGVLVLGSFWCGLCCICWSVENVPGGALTGSSRPQGESAPCADQELRQHLPPLLAQFGLRGRCLYPASGEGGSCCRSPLRVSRLCGNASAGSGCVCCCVFAALIALTTTPAATIDTPAFADLYVPVLTLLLAVVCFITCARVQTPSDRWDWADLRKRVAKHGVRNSLLLAPMPTASTAQILGYARRADSFL